MAQKTSPQAKAPAVTTKKVRQRKAPHYRSLQLHQRIKPALPPLKGAFRLFVHSLVHLKHHWKLFGGILLVYALIRLMLGLGLTGGLQLDQLKPTLDQLYQGQLSRLSSGVTLFGLLITSSGSSASASAGAYQGILVLAISLALIWALRQTLADKIVRLRDTFYQSMYPIVPFFLVLIVIGLQLLPLIIGGTLYNIVITNSLAVTAIEKAVWLILFGLLALLSLYMVSSSAFALYIVTLPNMTPMKALRSARQLVIHRRWTVLRKILFLPLALVVLAAVIIIPLIIFATRLAETVFFIYATAGLAIIHSYMYHLYRELL